MASRAACRGLDGGRPLRCVLVLVLELLGDLLLGPAAVEELVDGFEVAVELGAGGDLDAFALANGLPSAEFKLRPSSG